MTTTTTTTFDSLQAGRTIQGSNPHGGDIFRTSLDRPWGPFSLPYNKYRVSFPRVKRPGRGVNHPPPSSAEIKEQVERYLHSPTEPSWSIKSQFLWSVCVCKRRQSVAFRYIWPADQISPLRERSCTARLVHISVRAVKCLWVRWPWFDSLQVGRVCSSPPARPTRLPMTT
jgi:hypothetical protein